MEYINDINAISRFLSIIRYEVELKGSLNLYDENIFCEKIFCDLLNLVYDLKLVNSNLIEKNEAAFDLDDKKHKIVYQITSTTSSAKIKHTIEEFIKNNCYKKYKKLKVILIGKKPSYRTEFDSQGLFVFDQDKDILDLQDIIKKLYSLSPEKAHEIKLKMDSYNIKDSHIIFPSEEQTIIDLINKITDSDDYVEEVDSNVDPELKIRKRFAAFAKRIEEEFIEATRLYGEKFEEIVSGFSKRDIIKLSNYLKNKSIEVLASQSNNPIEALNELVTFFSRLMNTASVSYDLLAIKYFIVYEIIECNVFPNTGEDMNND